MSEEKKSKIAFGGSLYDCPVRHETFALKEIGKSFVRSMRRLRKALNNCKICEFEDTCEFRTSFNQQVDQVIREIQEEWNREVHDAG